MERKELEAAVEAILFAAGEPVPAERLCLALEMSREQIDALCGALADRYRYDRCGLRLVQLGESYQLCSAPEHAPVIRKALEGRRPPKLSQTALEVLSIVEDLPELPQGSTEEGQAARALQERLALLRTQAESGAMED